MTEAIAAGTELGAYRVTALLGRGGMGTVYRATHKPDGRDVALKVLARQLGSSDEFRRRFLREARYTSEVRHPAVVQVHEVGQAGDRLFLAMDLVEGTDLRSLLALEGTIEPRRALALLRQAASALDAVHAAGILHRDVKPANFLIGEDDSCYVTDFGLSKNPAKDSVALTGAGTFVGSFYYSSPEQVLGKETRNTSDVYSLGCVLFECLTGEPPFSGKVAAEVLEAHIEDPPPKLTAKRPDLPPAIDAVIERAMAKAPGDRHATCMAMIDAAAEALGVTAGDDVAAEEVPATLVLVVTGGLALGAEMRVTDELEIGRRVEGDGRLGGDAELSRRHARIARTVTGFTIEDLGSTNGTLVNGVAIEGARRLARGDTIQTGGTTMLVEGFGSGSDAGVAAAAAAPVEAVAPPPPAAPAPAAGIVSLRLEIDFAAGAAKLDVGDGGAALRLVPGDGGWRATE